jgi:hypothetical protein
MGGAPKDQWRSIMRRHLAVNARRDRSSHLRPRLPSGGNADSDRRSGASLDGHGRPTPACRRPVPIGPLIDYPEKSRAIREIVF